MKEVYLGVTQVKPKASGRATLPATAILMMSVIVTSLMGVAMSTMGIADPATDLAPSSNVVTSFTAMALVWMRPVRKYSVKI